MRILKNIRDVKEEAYFCGNTAFVNSDEDYN